jgi:hypothetical protein
MEKIRTLLWRKRALKNVLQLTLYFAVNLIAYLTNTYQATNQWNKNEYLGGRITKLMNCSIIILLLHVLLSHSNSASWNVLWEAQTQNSPIFTTQCFLFRHLSPTQANQWMSKSCEKQQQQQANEKEPFCIKNKHWNPITQY